MYTQRHYRTVAGILRDNASALNRTAWLDPRFDQPEKIHRLYVDSFASMFAADNPRFKRDTFVAACTPND